MLRIPRWAFKIHTTLQQIYERPYNVQNKQWNGILRTQSPTKEAFRVFVVHQFRPRCQLVHNNMWCVMWNINPLQAKSVQNETCWEEFVCDVNGVSSDMPWYLNTFPSFSYTPVMRVKKTQQICCQVSAESSLKKRLLSTALSSIKNMAPRHLLDLNMFSPTDFSTQTLICHLEGLCPAYV